MLEQVMLDWSLSLETKGLYGLLYVLCRDGEPVRIAALADKTGCARKTIRQYLAPLAANGLITIGKSDQDPRAHLVSLTSSARDRAHAMIEAIIRRLGQARRRIRDEGSKESMGEALMKEWLSLLIDDRTFSDNARPGFLVSPLTGERLEYDRWYPALKLAWEFQGPQHFQTGELQPDAQKLARQQNNDMVKIGASQREGILLVEVQARDLRLDRMVDLIPPGVPLRSLEGLESVIHFLEEESAKYRERAGLRD